MNAAPFVLLAASAVALLYLSEQGDQDVASFTPGDIIGSATGDLLDMTGTYTGGDPNQNRQAFLDMIAQSEIGAALLAETDNGYNVLVGATPANPLTFSDYSQHPRIYNAKFNSTAAGRYQINWPTYQTVSRQTGLTDFSPDTQDAMALQLCSNKGALDDIDAGNIQAAIAKCAPVWASLAGAGYGQHENSMTNLVAWFTNAGGVTA